MRHAPAGGGGLAQPARLEQHVPTPLVMCRGAVALPPCGARRCATGRRGGWGQGAGRVSLAPWAPWAVLQASCLLPRGLQRLFNARKAPLAVPCRPTGDTNVVDFGNGTPLSSVWPKLGLSYVSSDCEPSLRRARCPRDLSLPTPRLGWQCMFTKALMCGLPSNVLIGQGHCCQALCRKARAGTSI